MYKNIGVKIKFLAQVIAVAGVFGSALIGFILIGQGANAYNGEALVGWGVGVLLGGSLVSWIGSWFMYGFGELIQKTTEIARNTAKSTSSGSLTTQMENEEKMKTLIMWRKNNMITEEEFEIKKQALLRGNTTWS